MSATTANTSAPRLAQAGVGTDPRVREVLATLALAGYTAATLSSFVRIFDSWEFANTVIGAALGIHAMSLAARLFGARPLWLTLGLPLVSGWLFLLISYRPTMPLLIPTSSSFAAVRNTLSLIISEFPTAIPPLPTEPPWIVLAVASAVLVATVSELFAFAARGVGESLAPGAFVFVLIAALGSNRDRVGITLALISTGIVAVAALGWHHDRRERLQPASRPLPTGGLIVLLAAALVALTAGWIGPRLPGANDEAMIDPTNNAGGGSVTTITSPMVDIRSRLTNQSELTMFVVSSDEPTYWRATTLPEFDGTAFRLPARELESVDEPGEPTTESNTQKMIVAQLGGRTVPAAAEPREAEGLTADGDSVQLRINRDTSTLVAPVDLQVGDSFTIVSQQPAVAAANLQNAPVAVPPDEIYTATPESLPGIVATTAQEVTASQTTQYGKMLALQNWFREFDYSVDLVPAGHSTTAIEAFLERRVGYCEQFAATFAAMARTLGYASRVGVGFTTGEPTADGGYVVRGRNAHAWPEIYFGGLGWVSFEPTPGRGIPGAEQYTGVDAPLDDGTSQDDATPPSTTSPGAPSGTAPSNTRPPQRTVPPSFAPQANPGDPGNPTGGGDQRPWWPVLLVVAVGAALVATPPLLRSAKRAKERQLEPTDRTISAWKRSMRAAERVGVDAPPGATPTQWARATTRVAPVAGIPMQSLAAAYDTALYASDVDKTRLDPEQVSGWADEVESATLDTLDTRGRIARWFKVG